jgi:hypothetical protein
VKNETGTPVKRKYGILHVVMFRRQRAAQLAASRPEKTLLTREQASAYLDKETVRGQAHVRV